MENRVKISKLIEDICEQHEKWESFSYEKKSNIIRKMERSCYNKSIRECNQKGISTSWISDTFIKTYSAITYKLISNLDVNSVVGSNELIESIMDDKIDINKIAECSSYELTPSATQSDRDLIALRRLQKVTKKLINKKCRKCGHVGAEYEEYQARRADEATSESYRCESCKYVWH